MSATAFISLLTTFWDPLTLSALFEGTSGIFRSLAVDRFFVAAFGAFAGGYVGFAFRRKESRLAKLETAFLNYSYASAVYAIVCNSALGAKKQFFQELHEVYESERNRILTILGTPTRSKPDIYLTFQLLLIGPQHYDVESVVEAARGVADGDARNLSQAIALKESLQNVEFAMSARNDWISKFRDRYKPPKKEAFSEYFGVEDKDGNIDNYYRSLIRDIKASNDASIFHSYELYLRTTDMAYDLAVKLRKASRKNIQFSFADFSAPFDAGLFPKRSEFSDWLAVEKAMNRPWYYSRRRWSKLQKSKIPDPRWAADDN